MGLTVKAITAPFRAVGRGLKSFTTRMVGYGSHYANLLLPRSSFNYAAEIGDGSRSNIVAAVVGWICRTFPEAPVIVTQEQADGTRERMNGHRLPRLLEHPNPHYSGVLLWMATMADWAMGNAYWIKRRIPDGPLRGMVQELWWAPSWTMEPAWEDGEGKPFIDHYDYMPDPTSGPVPIRPEDVVHFRYGIDPYNTRKGCSPLRTLWREIFTDEEAANFTAALMKNLGVPGIVVSPDGQNTITPEQAEQTKQTIMEKFGGDRRGEPLVQLSATKVQVLSFSPEQMLLRDLRRVPEERVTAVYGVAAVVVGLGAGLDRATFSNFAEAREAATEGNIVPTQRLIGADLTLQLGPDFWGDDASFRCEFDLMQMRALQPDVQKTAEWMGGLLRDGGVMVAEVKRALGLPVSADDFVYLRSKNIDVVKPDNELLNPPAVVPALPAPKSNGHDPVGEKELVV